MLITQLISAEEIEMDIFIGVFLVACFLVTANELLLKEGKRGVDQEVKENSGISEKEELIDAIDKYYSSKRSNHS